MTAWPQCATSEGQEETRILADEAVCRLAREVLGVTVAMIDRSCRNSGTLVPGVVELWRRHRASNGVEAIEDVPAMAPDLVRAFDPHCSSVGFCALVPFGSGHDQAAPAGALVLLDANSRVLTAETRRALCAFADILAAQDALEATARQADEQTKLYRLLADNSTDTIVRGSLDGIRLYISPAVRALLGYEPSELVGRRAIEIVHPDDVPEFRELMRQIREGRIEEARSEQRQRHKSGRWVWIEAFIRLTYDKVTGKPDGYVVSVRDISRRKAAEERLAHLAAHDGLTGLANRSLLQERLEKELERAREAGTGFAVLCLDLDRFKQVNDTLGHEAGDTVLRIAAQRFVQTSPADGLVARLGGDEFVIVVAAGADPRGRAERLSARLIESTGQPISCGETLVELGLSVGIAVASREMVAAGCSEDALLRDGDRALYLAKESGRNRYVFAASRDETSPASR